MASTFPIVAIGASAGGLEAVTQLLTHLPAESGMALVLIQHLDPAQPSELANILARATAMPVVPARDGEEIAPNHLYVIEPGTALEIGGGRLRVTPREKRSHPDFLIDRFLRSLALDARERAVAVILSGSGSDGALGVCEIKAAGGVIIAQDPATAGHESMPQAAEQTGFVDFVLPPADIGRRLVAIAGHTYLQAPETAAETPDQAYDEVIEYVRSATGVDFSGYRATTIARRILRRAMLLGHESIARYLDHLKQNAAEVRALYFDLLINVTSFFRDPGLFEALKTTVIPAILDAKQPNAPVRVWVAGCSTGQEAYSIAMLVMECLDSRPPRPVQIFATDLSGENILAKARAGIYPHSIEAEVTAARLARFFDREDAGYRVKKPLRDACVFAQQNITSDPPFSHVDLIACRNVLIYMSPALQQHVIRVFHYALDMPGYLVLGSSESIGALDNYFDVTDRAAKIYARKPDLPGVPRMWEPRLLNGSVGAPAIAQRAAVRADFHEEIDRLMLSRYAPPGVLIDEHLNVVEFRGNTSAYLAMPAGEPTTSLVKLAPENLMAEVRSALDEVRTSGRGVVRDDTLVQLPGGPMTIDLEILPIPPVATRPPCFLVLFHDSGAFRRLWSRRSGFMDKAIAKVQQWLPVRRAEIAADAAEIGRLRQQHDSTRDFMQLLVNERDAGNEELRAANEEVLSANEELQSTNEELQTSKEEVQSINEELTTVNEQLKGRNAELTQINNDFANLLASTNIALVAVDHDLNIRFHTPPATKKMNLLPTDIGRPLGHIRPAIAVDNLEELVRGVVETGMPLHRELRDREGRWQSLRVYPYRAGERTDGAVIVLVDIDDLRQRQNLMQEATLLKVADQRKNEFLAMIGHELRNPLAPMANGLHILRDPASTPAQKEEMLGVFERQLAQLTRIVEDLLDATRISQGKIELRRERLDVAKMILAAVETSRPSLDAYEHRIETHFCPVPVYVDADPLRLTQVLVNLLNNAAKFTPRNGHIEVACRRSEADPAQIEISVRDNGIGMSKKLLEHAFDLFTQAETYENRRRGGLGIGLTLVRKLVEMHAGSIEARSAGEGRGSEFIVRLPLADAAPLQMQHAADPPSTAPAASRRVLIIEDNTDQAQSLGALLSIWGHEVKTASKGVDGIALAEKFNPDVVLVDIGLPDISGYEVARRLREHASLRTACLIAQTGWGETSDRRRARNAGFDHHLLKPLDPAALRPILTQGPRAVNRVGFG